MGGDDDDDDDADCDDDDDDDGVDDDNSFTMLDQYSRSLSRMRACASSRARCSCCSRNSGDM